jgi:hypothetical protein
MTKQKDYKKQDNLLHSGYLVSKKDLLFIEIGTKSDYLRIKL